MSRILALPVLLVLALSGASSAQPAATAPTDSAISYVMGDRLRVSFFEQLDPAQRPGEARAVPRSFYQRIDLTGEYTVETDGTISLPRLGRFVVAGRGEVEVRRELSGAFERDSGRGGDVHVAILERQPVYVIGAVRNAGAFRYAPGMIAIQAVALAGGPDQPKERSLPARDPARSSSAESRLGVLLARRAVLEAERDRRMPSLPAELIDLVPRSRAQQVLNVERSAALRAAELRAADVRRLDEMLRAAREELRALRAAADQAGRAAGQRTAQVAELTEPDPRLNNRPLLFGLQAEAASLDLHRRQAEIAAAQVEQRIAQASGERARVDAAHRAAVTHSIAAVNAEIATIREDARLAGAVAQAVRVRAAPDAGSDLGIRLVRRGTGEPLTFDAAPTTRLQPGDVVEVRSPGRPASAVPASPARP